MFGLALMTMCINVVQEKLKDTFSRASAKLGATIGVTVTDEDGSIHTVPPGSVEIPEVHNVGKENNVFLTVPDQEKIDSLKDKRAEEEK